MDPKRFEASRFILTIQESTRLHDTQRGISMFAGRHASAGGEVPTLVGRPEQSV